MRALGLPWYGGRLPKQEKADRIVAEGSKIAHQALEVMTDLAPALNPLDEQAEHMGQALLYGMARGLTVGADVCDEYMRMRTGSDGRPPRGLDELDPKVARMAIDVGMAMTRLGSKVMEEAFQRRRDDTVGKLLEQLRVTEGEKKEGS